MARTVLTAQPVSAASPLADVQLAAVDAANGNRWRYTGRGRLLVRNDDAAAVTVTVLSARTVAGLAVDDRPVSIPAGGTAYIVESAEARQADDSVYVDWSSGTAVTAALITE